MLPAWSASTTHVPVPVKLTTPLVWASEQDSAVLEESILKLTARPELVVAEGENLPP